MPPIGRKRVGARMPLVNLSGVRNDNRRRATVKIGSRIRAQPRYVYRMIGIFRAGGTVTSLMGKPPGRLRGHRALDPKREALIQETIRTLLPQADKAVSRTPRS